VMMLKDAWTLDIHVCHRVCGFSLSAICSFSIMSHFWVGGCWWLCNMYQYLRYGCIEAARFWTLDINDRHWRKLSSCYWHLVPVICCSIARMLLCASSCLPRPTQCSLKQVKTTVVGELDPQKMIHVLGVVRRGEAAIGLATFSLKHATFLWKKRFITVVPT